jgi:endonuclease/exonuclease/phosphatase family metal-dependent hydrolase
MIKKIIYLYILCQFSIIPIELKAIKATQNDTIKIVSWNIKMVPKSLAIITKSARKKQKERAPKIIQYLNNTNFDIIVLQELFDKSITKKFAADLSINYPYILSPIKEGFSMKMTSGVMILSKYPYELINHEIFNVSKKTDNAAQKACSLVKININGKKILLGGIHLDSKNKESRILQCELTSEKIIKPFINDTIPMFLVGDFNVNKTSASYDSLSTLFDLENYQLNDDRPYTFDEFNSWNEKGYKAWIDFIFYQDSDKIEVLDQYIYRPVMIYKKTKMDLSDHYQIVLKAVIR